MVGEGGVSAPPPHEAVQGAARAARFNRIDVPAGERPMAEMAGEGDKMPPSPHELVTSSTHALAWCCVEQRLS